MIKPVIFHFGFIAAEDVLRLMKLEPPVFSIFDYECFTQKRACFFARQFQFRGHRRYLACGVPAMRRIFRYCFSMTSGIYADADTACINDRQLVCSVGSRFFVRAPEQVANDFMIVKRPRDPSYGTHKVSSEQYPRTQIEQRMGSNWSGIMTKLFRTEGESRNAAFTDFKIDPIRVVRQYIRFNWKLATRTDSHWTERQKCHPYMRTVDN